jgi:hypothetical protein
MGDCTSDKNPRAGVRPALSNFIQLWGLMEFNSFTKTWIEFVQGTISSEQLQSAEKIQFNCTREHLFPDEDTIAAIGNTLPCEVTWADNSQSVHNCSRVPASFVSRGLYTKFGLFLDAIGHADRQGRVTFREDPPAQSARLHDEAIAECRERWPECPTDGCTSLVAPAHDGPPWNPGPHLEECGACEYASQRAYDDAQLELLRQAEMRYRMGH